MRLALLFILVTGAAAACSGGASPPGASKALGTVDQGGYLFLRWQNGLEVMIWHDLTGESASHSAGSSSGRLYIEHGSVHAASGRSLAWEVHTRDGRTGDVQIEGDRYALAGGNLFLVTTHGGATVVTQLPRDLSDIPLDHDGILAFAGTDPDLIAFLDGVPPPAATPHPSTRTFQPELAGDRIRSVPGATQAEIEDNLPVGGQTTNVVGTVMDVSPSARTIMLAEPVEGFSVIALIETSRLVSASGAEITLRDIQAGSRVQASGQPGASQALLADQVLVLSNRAREKGPSPVAKAGLRDREAVYEIRVEGALDSSWSAWPGGLEVRPLDCGETVITGPVRDQAALHGLLKKIRDLGLPLLGVEKK